MSSLSSALVFFLGGDDVEALTATVTVDHVRTGLARLSWQFRSANPMDEPENRTNMEKLAAVLLRPFDELELAFQQLMQLRDLATAVGVHLDAIGRLLQQERGDLGDEDYRRYLFARIATNRSTGRRSDLIKIAKLILNDTDVQVVVENRGPAAVIVRIENSLVPDALAAILIDFLGEAVAAAVRIGLESSPELIEDQFAFPLATFADGAHLATATTLTVDSTEGFPVIGTLEIDLGTADEETVDYAGSTSTTFTLVDPLANNHSDRAAVQLEEPSTGDGFGDEAEGENLVAYSDVGTTGGTLIDFRENML